MNGGLPSARTGAFSASGWKLPSPSTSSRPFGTSISALSISSTKTTTPFSCLPPSSCGGRAALGCYLGAAPVQTPPEWTWDEVIGGGEFPLTVIGVPAAMGGQLGVRQTGHGIELPEQIA